MRGPAVEIDRIVREVLAELPAATGGARPCGPHRLSVNGEGVLAGCKLAQHPQAPPLPLPGRRGNSRRVIAVSDLNGLDRQGELVVPRNAIITPLAREYLKERGVTIKHGASETSHAAPSNDKTHASTRGWGYAILDSSGLAAGAVQAVARQGTPLTPLATDCLAAALRASVEAVAAGTLCGAILFCDDAALVACAANKRPGIRAAVAQSPEQVARAGETLAANVLVVEPSGKTLHELRNILRAFCNAALQQPAQHVVELLGDR